MPNWCKPAFYPGADTVARSRDVALGQRFLIVNADDFGRSEAVNLGVAEGFTRGIVTSASIVAAGPAFESAMAIASNLPGLGVGVHLVADEYTPVLPPAEIPRLVNSEGRFFSRGHQFFRMAWDPRLRGDLLREWDAQISKIVRSGIKLTHIDGHGHCHVHPAAARVLLQLAKRYGISSVRMPAEAITWNVGRIRPARFLEKSVLWLAAQVPRSVWTGQLSFPRFFYGFSHSGRMTESVVRQVAETARPGVSELMVHVGVSNDESAGFWTGYDYTGDLRAVTFRTKQQFEKEFGVFLVTHTLGGNVDSGDQRRFWDQHITEWAASAYEKGENLPFIERIAQPWRKHLKQREVMAVDILLKWAPAAVLELGCGTGGFAASFLQASPTIRRYRAFDISEAACAKARDRVRPVTRENVDATVQSSSVEDLDSTVFQDFDVVVGLGLVPYLTDPGFVKLAAVCKGKSFLFDYHPREATLFNGIHVVYRKVKGYPFYRVFSEPELAETMARFGFAKYELIRRGPLRFMRSL